MTRDDLTGGFGESKLGNENKFLRWLESELREGSGDDDALRFCFEREQKIAGAGGDLRHRDGRLRVELLPVELELFGHASPVLGVEVVVGSALN